MSAEKVVRGRFYLPKENRYIYRRILIAPSTISRAGDGAYAIDYIPKGATGVYRGVKRGEDKAVMLYSWAVYDYDETGQANGTILHYLDASNLNTSNWARWVNCGLRKNDNNMVVDQRFDKVYYIATRDIEPGEELLIDYGEGYRRDNLKMRGPY